MGSIIFRTPVRAFDLLEVDQSRGLLEGLSRGSYSRRDLPILVEIDDSLENLERFLPTLDE